MAIDDVLFVAIDGIRRYLRDGYGGELKAEVAHLVTHMEAVALLQSLPPLDVPGMAPAPKAAMGAALKAIEDVLRKMREAAPTGEIAAAIKNEHDVARRIREKAGLFL